MSIAGRLLSGAIRLYQLAVSPYLAMSCRYQPTCSSYAREAIARRGAAIGGFMALGRLARCHPWGGSGYDPVPPVEPKDNGKLMDQGLPVEPGA